MELLGFELTKTTAYEWLQCTQENEVEKNISSLSYIRQFKERVLPLQAVWAAIALYKSLAFISNV